MNTMFNRQHKEIEIFCNPMSVLINLTNPFYMKAYIYFLKRLIRCLLHLRKHGLKLFYT